MAFSNGSEFFEIDESVASSHNSFARASNSVREDEYELIWAAFDRLPSRKRSHTAIIKRSSSNAEDGDVPKFETIDVSHLDRSAREQLVKKALATNEQDNYNLLARIKERFDRVGLEVPNVEVRFKGLNVSANVHTGGRALPTLVNYVRDSGEKCLEALGVFRPQKHKLTILNNMNGVVKPGRMTLLLGPPGSGKSTLLMALAGKLDSNLETSGDITYSGHTLEEFFPQRTSVYISQTDNHIGELTVRETLDFAARCQGASDRFSGYLNDLAKLEKEKNIRPSPEIDAFMKATSVGGKKHSLATDYTLRVLGLDVCADTIVGSDMVRGVSGGQRKRVTTGEMVVGPRKTLFMDEISTGLDSATTFQIVKCIRNFVHQMDGTVLMALLQPAPETFDLFDDLILLSEGHVIYQGPRTHVLEFFESLGFVLPPRKGVADFLQEVTSRKDQAQYWAHSSEPYVFVPVTKMADAFKQSEYGKCIETNISVPFDKAKVHPSALAHTKYAVTKLELFKACFAREVTLIGRHRFLYIFRTCQVAFVGFITCTMFLRTRVHPADEINGNLYLSCLFFGLVHMMFNGFSELPIIISRLPVFYKQRNNLFYPAWAFSISSWILRIPYSIVEAVIWSCVVYYTVGFVPSAARPLVWILTSDGSLENVLSFITIQLLYDPVLGNGLSKLYEDSVMIPFLVIHHRKVVPHCWRFFRFMLLLFTIHQMALGLFRMMGALARDMIIANTFGSFSILVVFLLGGFVLPKDSIKPWWIWAFWVSPLSYGQSAISVNEFTAPRWMQNSTYGNGTIGLNILNSHGLPTNGSWYWIGVGALIAYTFLFNILVTLALSYLKPLGKAQTVIPLDNVEGTVVNEPDLPASKSIPTNGRTKPDALDDSRDEKNKSERGMILPFQPLSMTFHNVNYYVDMPKEMRQKDVPETRLQLLSNVSGVFRPGILTALVGSSGAGKTTLMDVLAGRKTGGYIEGDVGISGHPKVQETFARISGYVEQSDIHSPQVTVEESLWFSSWLRLPKEVNKERRLEFVEEVMKLVELDNLRHALVGVPGNTGLSTEQRKRLTIAVELVANPSIIFMDEPTSGLDARAAAIVMRTVRNTVDTGRTVVCTIHQPSIDIFESFDELLLMKRGGRVIYGGLLGENSRTMINYFEGIKGVPSIPDGYNPATWMLEISTEAREQMIGQDFATIYRSSDQYRDVEGLIQRLSIPVSGSEPLKFDTKLSQDNLTQFKVCFWKQNLVYWRSPHYNVVRLFFTTACALIFGSVFWKVGSKRETTKDLFSVMGALYSACIFLGVNNASSIQPVISIERTVYYRERASGMYSSFPYAAAQGLVEIPYIAAQTLIFGFITYFMIDFEWTIIKFLFYLLFMFLTFTYFAFYGMMAVGLTPSQHLAAVISSAFYSIWNLLSGFLVPKPKIPGWWIWFYYICPLAWTLRGIITSQLGDVDSLVVGPGIELPVNEYLEEYLGYTPGFTGVCVAVLFGFIFLFFSVYAFSIKCINFQKR